MGGKAKKPTTKQTPQAASKMARLILDQSDSLHSRTIQKSSVSVAKRVQRAGLLQTTDTAFKCFHLSDYSTTADLERLIRTGPQAPGYKADSEPASLCFSAFRCQSTQSRCSSCYSVSGEGSKDNKSLSEPPCMLHGTRAVERNILQLLNLQKARSKKKKKNTKMESLSSQNVHQLSLKSRC